MSKARKVALAALTWLVMSAVSAWAADDILGLWKIIDDKSGKPTAVVSLYSYQGKVYGRILVTISKTTGQVEDTILTKTKKATALAGDPPNCGLDFVYELTGKGSEWKGSIVDPEDGKEYNCTIKREGDKLTVRGSLKGTGGLLGRNQTWLKSVPGDLPSGFQVPNPSSFVPVIPRKK